MLNKRKVMVFFIFGILGFCAVFLLWPKNDKLPVFGSIKDYHFEDIYHGPHHLTNDKVKIATFFYTRCPDICPLTMNDFTELQAKLKQAGMFGDDVEIVSISFDPEHDTEDVLRNYARSFQADPVGWKWLRGTPDVTKQLAEELKVQYKQIDEHFYSHSTTMFLIDQKNQVRGLYDMAYQSKPVDIEKIFEDIHYLVSKRR